MSKRKSKRPGFRIPKGIRRASRKQLVEQGPRLMLTFVVPMALGALGALAKKIGGSRSVASDNPKPVEPIVAAQM